MARRWFHVTWGTYGSWLPGDPRGFRDHDHRVHSSGTYKHLPPEGEHALLHQFAKRSGSRGFVALSRDEMTTVCDAVRSKCAAMDAELMAIAVAATHVHALVLLDEERVGTEVGMMKREASKWLAEKRPGGLWSRRCHPRRVFHPEHRQRAHEYIMAHRREGAVVWSAVLGTDAL